MFNNDFNILIDSFEGQNIIAIDKFGRHCLQKRQTYEYEQTTKTFSISLTNLFVRLYVLKNTNLKSRNTSGSFEFENGLSTFLTLSTENHLTF